MAIAAALVAGDPGCPNLQGLYRPGQGWLARVSGGEPTLDGRPQSALNKSERFASTPRRCHGVSALEPGAIQLLRSR